MKRIAILLLAVLLLAGCGKRKQNSTEPTNTEPTVVELYAPGSSAEKASGGALKCYPLPITSASMVYNMGVNLLIAGDKQLMVVSGEQGQVVAQKSVETGTSFSRVVVSATGVGYYLAARRQVVILNPQLQEVNRITMPKDMVDMPVISLTRSEIFYSNGKEIRALHLITGITRLVRQQLVATQTIQSAGFDDSVLLCQLTEGKTVTDQYISSETGQTLSENNGILDMQTLGDRFFLHQMDGQTLQSVFGSRDGQAQTLLPDLEAETYGALAMGGAVSSIKEGNISTLSFYQLETGKRTAQVALPANQSTRFACSDGVYIWVLVNDDTTSDKIMYRWDVSRSACADAAVYTGPHYTLDNPNEAALAACNERVVAIENEQKIWLAIWKNAEKYAGTHTIVMEHQPQTLNKMLTDLEEALSKLPYRFIYETMNRKRMRIALVRSIDDGEDYAQFWKDGTCYILIASKSDVAQSLYQGIAYAVDSFVIGNSRDYDNWSDLNPEGFAYTYSYDVSGDSQYLTGTNKAFADLKSMSHPHEDRCSIFSNAMVENNSAMFQLPAMQAKLKAVCMAIREAYHLEQSTKTYAWEQYLTESLAYVAPQP